MTHKTFVCDTTFELSINEELSNTEIDTSGIASTIYIDSVSVCIGATSYPDGSIDLTNLLVPASGSFSIGWYYGTSVPEIPKLGIFIE